MFHLMMPFLTLKVCCSGPVSTKNNFQQQFSLPLLPFSPLTFAAFVPKLCTDQLAPASTSFLSCPSEALV